MNAWKIFSGAILFTFVCLASFISCEKNVSYCVLDVELNIENAAVYIIDDTTVTQIHETVKWGDYEGRGQAIDGSERIWYRTYKINDFEIRYHVLKQGVYLAYGKDSLEPISCVYIRDGGLSGYETIVDSKDNDRGKVHIKKSSPVYAGNGNRLGYKTIVDMKGNDGEKVHIKKFSPEELGDTLSKKILGKMQGTGIYIVLEE